MNAKEMKFYASFSVDVESKSSRGFCITSDLESAKSWRPSSVPAKETATEPEGELSDSSMPFQELGMSLISRIYVFRRTVPFLMSRAPILLKSRIDARIRREIVAHGNPIEKSDYTEIFEIPNEILPKITAELGRLKSIMDGLKKLPDLFLIGLISSYDAFLSDLIRSMLLSRPEIISLSERNLSFKDLVEIGSIDAAREKIIEKEIDSILRGSHAEQIAWIENKANLKIKENNPLWAPFIEICERRNLFVHTDGIVNQQYVNVCKQNGCAISHSLGDVILMEPDYFKKSVEVLLEFGLKLHQVVWRKLKPTEIAVAEERFSAICYDMLSRKDFEIAYKLLDFAINDLKKFKKDSSKRVAIINRAIALKELGMKSEAIKSIDSEDWSSTSDKYKICVHAIRDEDNEVVSMIQSAVSGGQIEKDDLRNWPAFRRIRSNIEFQNKFEEIFGEKIIQNIDNTKQQVSLPAQIEELKTKDQSVFSEKFNSIERGVPAVDELPTAEPSGS